MQTLKADCSISGKKDLCREATSNLLAILNHWHDHNIADQKHVYWFPGLPLQWIAPVSDCGGLL